MRKNVVFTDLTSETAFSAHISSATKIIGTIPNNEANIIMRTLEDNGFFANDTCKLIARIVTENSIKPEGKEPSTCQTIFHWGMASSGASRSGSSVFCKIQDVA